MLLPSPPDNFDHFVGLAVGHHQWRSKPDDVIVGGLCDHTVIQQLQGKVPPSLFLPAVEANKVQYLLRNWSSTGCETVFNDLQLD